MSKKKNTLKDLDEFLKQQAATLVSPSRLSDKTETPNQTTETPPPAVEVDKSIAPVEKVVVERKISTHSIAKDLRQLAVVNGTSTNEELCDVLLTALENQTAFSAEDKMLINTALYLKHGSAWKEAIREFWRNKK